MTLATQTAECVGASTIVALAEGDLQEPGRVAVLRHVDGCPDCAELVAQAVRLGSSDRTALGRYVVIDELGSGGMGHVLLAYDPKLRRELALKIVRLERLDPARGARALRNEARTLAQLEHTNIVNVFDVQDADEQLFIAMEYVKGAPLNEWLRAENRTQEETLAVFMQAGAGLQAAHDASVVHRDFKPSNVIVGDDGRVVVLDFGLAKAFDATDSRRSTGEMHASARPDGAGSTLSLTTSRIAGTPVYMAPEQYEGRADPRSDQYAFCVTLFEALLGRRPFASKELGELIQDKSARAFDRRSLAKLPRRVASAIERGLSPDPDDRWDSVAQLCGRLRRRRSGYGWPAAGLGGTAAIAAAWLVAARVPDPCDDADSKLQGTWDGARRGSVADAFNRTQLEIAPAQLELTAARMDKFAAQWEDAFAEACRAGQEGSEELLDARMRCLRRGLEKFRIISHALSTADASLVRDPLARLDALPDPQRCAADGVVEKYPPLPQDKVAAADQLSIELSRAELRTQDHSFARTRTVADGLVERARELEHPPLLLRALAVRIGVAPYSEQPEQSSLFDEAYRLARDLERADRAAEVALLAAYNYLRRGNHAECEQWLELARIEVERSDLPEQRSSLAMIQSGIALDKGETEESIELSIVALDHMREADPGGLGYAAMLANLAGSYRFLGKFPAATKNLDEARAIVLEVGGEHHPMLQHIYIEEGALLEAQGEFERSVPAFERAIEALTVHQGPHSKEVVTARQGLARSYTQLDRFDDAKRELEAALSIAAKIEIDPHEEALIYLVLGAAEAGRGDREAAEAAFVSGLGALDHAGASPRADEIRDHIERRRKELTP